jgi:hypothetical protein
VESIPVAAGQMPAKAKLVDKSFKINKFLDRFLATVTHQDAFVVLSESKIITLADNRARDGAVA